MTQLRLSELAIWLAVAFALSAFVLQPLLLRGLAGAAERNKPRWAIAVLIFGTARLMLLAALISTLVTWSALKILTMGTGVSSEAVSHVIERLQSFKGVIDEIKVGAWASGFVFAAIALGIWIIRRRRSQFTNARQALFQDKLNRLIGEMNDGTLPPMEPTSDMIALAEKIGAIDSEILKTAKTLDEAETDEKKEAARAALAQLAEARGPLVQSFVARDLIRRVEVPPLDPDLIDLPPPARSLWQKIGRIFVSRGMFRQLSLGQRALLLLNLILIVPTLLTLTGDSLLGEIGSRITNLDQLRVDLFGKELEKRFDAARRIDAPPTTQTDTVDEQSFARVAYAHARAFEEALVRHVSSAHLLPESAPNARGTQAILREHDARRRILSVVAETANRPPAVGGPSVPPGARKVEVHGLITGSVPEHIPVVEISGKPITLDEIAQRAGASARDPIARPLTPAGENLARDIISRGASDTGFRQRVVQSFRSAGASFMEAARPSQLRGVLMVAALGGSAEGAVMTNVVAEPAAKWAAEVMEPGFRARAYQATSKTYLATLLETGRADAAIKAVETMADHQLLRAEVQRVRSTIAPRIRSEAQVVADLQRFQPGLVELHDGITNPTARDTALKRYYESAAHRAAIPAANMEAVIADAVRNAGARASFERYFPSDHSAGGPPAASGPVRPQPGRAPPISTPAKLVTDAGRARSFVRLRGYSRVGGVLIGRDAEPGPKLDIRSMRWKVQNGRVTLTLTDADRRQMSIGPIRASIVYAALGYAADGRPLTATMTTADPLSELRILLHPVLVDTSVGCRAIEIDRFVDEATSDSNLRIQLGYLATIQRSLYASARLALFRAVFSNDEAKQLVGRDEQVAALADMLASPAQAGPAKDVLAAAMGRPELLFDPKYSPLKVKTAYYHPEVVKLVEACAKPNGNFADFKSCLAGAAEVRAKTNSNLGSMEYINWTAPTPEFEPWSGVRERPYKIDSTFAFAGVGQVGTAPPEPFDFILQIAFTSPPYASLKTPWFQESPADADDTDPWLFPDGEIGITTRVVSLLKPATVKREIFEAMREFVWAQRLFRAALSGALGDAFPIDNLAELAKATSTHARMQRTVRWQLNAGEFRLLNELRSELEGLGTAARRQAEACIAVATLEGTSPKIYAMPDERWDRACRFSGDILPKHIVDLSIHVSEARRLRPALGILEESQLPDSVRACGPL
jgi:hypothetical protein